MKKLFFLISLLLMTSCSNDIINIQNISSEEVEANSLFEFIPQYEKKYTKFYNQKYPVAVIAHRGYRDVAPENTLASVIKAYQIGANMAEIDVGLTKDREVIVMHDDDLNRTTNGKGLVEEKTLSELKQLDAGSWFSPVFKGEKIPTLDEILEFAKGKISINIEIKPYSVEKRSQQGIEKKVIDIVKKHGMEEHVLISSFSEEAIKRVNNIDKNIPTALLLVSDGLFSSQTKKAAKVQADAINEFDSFIRESEIKKSHNNGIKINSYTTNNPNKMLQLINKGVNGIITDRPDLALRVLEEKFGK